MKLKPRLKNSDRNDIWYRTGKIRTRNNVEQCEFKNAEGKTKWKTI